MEWMKWMKDRGKTTDCSKDTFRSSAWTTQNARTAGNPYFEVHFCDNLWQHRRKDQNLVRSTASHTKSSSVSVKSL